MLVVIIILNVGLRFREKANVGRHVRPEPAAVYPDFDDYAEELKECAAEDAKVQAVERP